MYVKFGYSTTSPKSDFDRGNPSNNARFQRMRQNGGMFSTYVTDVQTSLCVCIICPKLVHSYLNCNIDALFTTDGQF